MPTFGRAGNAFHVAGRQIRKSTKRPLTDKKGAERVMMQEYQRLMDQHQLGAKPEIGLKDGMDRTLKTAKGSNLKVYSWASGVLLGGTKKDLGWSLDPKMKLSELTELHIEELKGALSGAGMSNNSINSVIRFLRRTHHHNSKSYLTNRDLEFDLVEGFVKTRFLSQDEEDRVLMALDKEGSDTAARAKDFSVFLLDTGVRLNEGLNLDWSMVNRSSHVVEIYRSKTKQVSLVPISDRVAEMLDRRGNQSQPFENMDWPVKLLRRTLNDVCNKNKHIVSDRGAATIHTFRDTFASRRAHQGMSLHKIALLLGHNSIHLTKKYSQLAALEVVEEARRLMNG